MGLFDLFRISQPQDEMLISKTVDPEAISEDQQARDLDKLMEFDRKIAAKKAVLDVSMEALSPEDAALKMKNPFRGA